MGSAAGSCRRLGWLAGRQRGVRTLIPTFAVSPGGRWETLLETPGHPGRSPARTGCSRSRTGGTAGSGPTRVSLANGPAEKGSDANPFTRPRTPFHCRRTSGPACDGRDRTGPSGERPGRIERADPMPILPVPTRAARLWWCRGVRADDRPAGRLTVGGRSGDRGRGRPGPRRGPGRGGSCGRGLEPRMDTDQGRRPRRSLEPGPAEAEGIAEPGPIGPVRSDPSRSRPSSRR